MGYSITIYVDVHDIDALKKHAETVYLQQTGVPSEPPEKTLKGWRALRKSHGSGPIEADLMMVFDPGLSPPGTSIQESVTEKI